MNENDNKLNQIIELILPNLILGDKIVAERKWYRNIDNTIPSQDYIAFSLMESNDLIEVRNTKNSLLTLSLKGHNIKNNGGWLKHLEQQSDTNKYLVAKEQLEIDNLKLKKESLEYSKTIRSQVDRIRDLEEQIKLISLIKLYWWFIPILISVGVFLSKIWDLVKP